MSHAGGCAPGVRLLLPKLQPPPPFSNLPGGPAAAPLILSLNKWSWRKNPRCSTASSHLLLEATITAAAPVLLSCSSSRTSGWKFNFVDIFFAIPQADFVWRGLGGGAFTKKRKRKEKQLRVCGLTWRLWVQAAGEHWVQVWTSVFRPSGETETSAENTGHTHTASTTRRRWSPLWDYANALLVRCVMSHC